MEKQGLRGATDILPQHGALLSAASAALQPATGSVSRLDFAEYFPGDEPELRSDFISNSRHGVLSFSRAGTHCSEATGSTSRIAQTDPRPGLLPFRHFGDTEREEEPRASQGRTSWRTDAAHPTTPAEEPEERRILTSRKLQTEEGTEQPCEAGLGLPGARRLEQADQELYVALNVVQMDGAGEEGRHRPDLPAEDRRRPPVSTAGLSGYTEAGVCLFEAPDNPTTTKRAPLGVRVPDDSLPVVLTTRINMEDEGLTNKYGDGLCGESFSGRKDCKADPEVNAAKPVEGFGPETEDMDSSDLISGPIEQRDSDHPELPGGDTFTGTITINNQNMVVSIENGVLTLAAPQDDLLGTKDHQDLVLLNYDSEPRGLVKPGVVMPGPGPQEQQPAERLLLSGLVKQESGLLEASSRPDRTATIPGSQEEPRPAPLSRSRKEIGVSLGCPEPGCYSSFDSRQKLKVHLLEHAEDPRPHRCPVQGCGWAFTTSYKLKRHLQSHDKQRPHGCQVQGCGRRFTTVYNLKAHFKVHEQDNSFTCQVCSERFRSSKRLSSHQRIHFEPHRPHKCEFPGCEKTFITFSALFSHNRTHFRETGHFTCTYPGCDKTYDKACRLKLHMRSHTGERPFVCNSEGCNWSFTSMSKLLRHKRKHDDDRRFVCTEEGCGKSFTRAEHLKGHSITHLGTKPFQCHAEGCNAKFSARSSLYIHSKKHKQDGSPLRSRCPVVNCSKQFSSRSNLKSHMVKHHHLSTDVINRMETTHALTPSNELLSSPPTSAGPCVAGGEQLNNLDLSSLFSAVPSSSVPTSSIGVGIPVGGGASSNTFTMDLFLVSSGILTIDPSTVGATMGPGASTALTKAVDPLILAPSGDIAHPSGLEATVGDVLPPQETLNLDDVPSVTPEALGGLAALSVHAGGSSVEPESTASLAVAPGTELLASSCKEVDVGGQANTAPLLDCVEVLGAHEGVKASNHFVFPSQSTSFSPQKDLELSAASPSSFLESGGSARTDYRAIQLAKKRKQKGPSASHGTLSQRKSKGGKVALTSALLQPSAGRYGDGAVAASGGLTLRDPVTGAQYVQIQLLQDDPPSDGDLAFQLSPQTSSSHSQLTVDLPVNILQEPSLMTEDDTGSDNSQFTGSTINLQDLE